MLLFNPFHCFSEFFLRLCVISACLIVDALCLCKLRLRLKGIVVGQTLVAGDFDGDFVQHALNRPQLLLENSHTLFFNLHPFSRICYLVLCHRLSEGYNLRTLVEV